MAAAPIPYIPEELLVAILVRVPAKSLLRWKATCKRWNSLIKSASFIHLHCRRQDYRDHLLFYRYEQKQKRTSFHSCPSPSLVDANNNKSNSDLIITQLLDFAFLPVSVFEQWPGPRTPSSPYSTILGPSNNGIYCVINTDCQRLGRISIATSQFILCNPTTREYKLANPFTSEAADLARDPSVVEYGFGPVCNNSGVVVDYKVVLIRISATSCEGSRFMSFVYSLRRGSWEKIADVRHGAQYDDGNKAIAGLVNGRGEVETPQSFIYGISRCPQLFLEGSWHWIEELRSTTASDNNYVYRVLNFDVANEVFGLIAGPPHVYESNDDDSWVFGGLSLLNDHLAMIYMPTVANLRATRWKCAGLDVWMMMEYGVEESWTKIYSCADGLKRSLAAPIGLCYSTVVTPTKDKTDDNNSSGSSNVQIHRIFLTDAGTGKLVSIDGSRVKEHNFYARMDDLLQFFVGASTYVESLESLTLPH